MADENQNPVTPPADDSNPMPPPPPPAEPKKPEEENFANPAAENPEPAQIPVEPEPTPEPETAQIPVVETEPVEPTPAPEPEPEPTPEPVEEGEIIAGAPTRPGDKPEKPEVESAPENSAPPAAPASTKNDSKNKTGFRPDGVTPLDAEEKIFAGVGYISFLCFLPLLARRDSEFAQHHARQATVVFVIFMFLWALGAIFSLAGFFAFLQIIEFIAGFVLAYKGDWFKIPGIYDLSLKLKSSPAAPTPPPQNPAVPNTPGAGDENEVEDDDNN